MNVREYLESIRALDLSIESKIRQEEMLRTRLTDTAAHIGGDVPRSSSPDMLPCQENGQVKVTVL